tara:strand:- start:869 stop:991 length:123 start_codon:yes stop_codon:yes gene_type:complete
MTTVASFIDTLLLVFWTILVYYLGMIDWLRVRKKDDKQKK